MTVPGASRRVEFAFTAVDGRLRVQTGLLHLPSGPAPSDGYPLAVYGHMTTGAGPRSAPNTGDPSHPEWRRMSQGDALCAALVRRGFAVVRPDYEGIGSEGPHPYLHGPSLGASMRAMVAARREWDDRLGDDWVAAGHSEGAHAALWASVEPEPDPAARLRATAAFAPVTRLPASIGAIRRARVRFPGSAVVSALIGLMLHGAAATDPELAALVRGEGTSARARALADHIPARSLTELSAPDSWGGLAPAAIGGPLAEAMYRRLFASFRASDPAQLRPTRAPVRLDLAAFDEVAPAPLSAGLVRAYRTAGARLTARWWPTHHSGVMRPRAAPETAAAWLHDRVRAG